MGTAAVWTVALLIVALVAIWRLDRYMRASLESQERLQLASSGRDELSERERAVKVQIAEDTAEAETNLRNAELRRRTAEANAAAGLSEELREDRLTAERRVIRAGADARVTLAKEFARQEHAAELEWRAPEDGESDDVVDMYARYMAATRGRGVNNFMDLEEFLRTLQDHGQLD